jgi:hypothetical protein
LLGATGTNVGELRTGWTGAQVTQDAHARYQEAVLRGGVYRLPAPNIVPTAFTGGAGGTPIVSIFNPTGSGKNCVILGVGITARILGAAVLDTSFNLWAGVSVANTGTATAPTNALTNVSPGGSVVIGSVNAATTSTTAVTLALPLASYFWGTSVGQYMSAGLFDVGGLVVCPPGCLVAMGSAVAITTAAFDSVMIWEEVPILS